MSLANIMAVLDQKMEAEFRKQAEVGDPNVLGGDRTKLETEGKAPAGGKLADEMTGSHDMANPTQDSYNASTTEHLNLEAERQAKAKANGEQTFADPEYSDVAKGQIQSAKMAQYVLNLIRKQAEDSSDSSDMTEEEKKKKEEDDEEEMAAKEAGWNSFYQLLHQQSSLGLHKAAQVCDPNYAAALERGSQQALTGARLADITINATRNNLMKGAQLADAAINVASQQYGAAIAHNTIQKVATDLMVVERVIDDLAGKGLISMDEKEKLVSALSKYQSVEPDTVGMAVEGLENAEVVAEAILNAMQGPQAANQPMQNVSPVSTPSPDSSRPDTPETDNTKEDAMAEDLEELVLKTAAAICKRRGAR